MNSRKKPLGIKNYGSIPHLPGSRRGKGDRGCSEQQAALAIVRRKSKRHTVIVQEKLDGSNVGVARIEDVLIPLGRAGWPAITSPYKQHQLFHNWVMGRCQSDFMNVLENGERIVGEWLAQAHGTRYDLDGREPFVAFDIMRDHVRTPYPIFIGRVCMGNFATPPLLSAGDACSIDEAMKQLNVYGDYGALDPVEGAVWRVEHDKPTGVKGKSRLTVLFLAKYVRPDKVDGNYLPEVSGEPPVWNWNLGDSL